MVSIVITQIFILIKQLYAGSHAKQVSVGLQQEAVGLHPSQLASNISRDATEELIDIIRLDFLTKSVLSNSLYNHQSEISVSM